MVNGASYSKNNLGFYLSQGFDVLGNNLCKQGFLFVLAYFSTTQSHSLLLANLAITIYILPFLFLSYLAGRHAEQRNKRRLIRQLKALDLLLLLMITLSYGLEAPWLTLLIIFLLGCKTAVMTPVKFAYMSERYHGNALIRSNAIMQTLSLTCMLVAITSAGFIIGELSHPVYFGCLLLLISLFGLLSSWRMQNSRAVTSNETSQGNIKTILRIMRISGCWPFAILIAWFWLISALFVSQFINFIKLEIDGTPAMAASALAIFITGMLAGAGILEWRKPKSLGFMLLSGGSLSLLTTGIALYQPTTQATLIATDLFDSAIELSLLLFATGTFATAYIAPVYARLQSLAPPDKVARIMGASSVLNALFICASTGIAFVILEVLALTLQPYFLAIGILNAVFFIAVFGWWQHAQASSPATTNK